MWTDFCCEIVWNCISFLLFGKLHLEIKRKYNCKVMESWCFVRRISMSSLLSLHVCSLKKAEMEAVKHLWHFYVGVEFLSSVILADNVYLTTFLCEDSKRESSFSYFMGTKVVSIFIFPVSSLEFSLWIPCYPVVLLWYWTAGIRLPVAL